MEHEMTLFDLVTTLFISAHDDDFTDICREVVEEMEKRADAIEAIEPILRLMELYPEAFYGNPGPLDRFVECFCEEGYEEKLVESVLRKPTIHTLWMLNRVANISTDEAKQRYLSVLVRTVCNEELDEDIRYLANDLLNWQQRNQ